MSAATVTAQPGFLDRARDVAGPGYSRWLVPPCASQFICVSAWPTAYRCCWLPLHKAVRLTKPLDVRRTWASSPPLPPPPATGRFP